MNDFKDKLITAAIILACLGVLYYRASSGGNNNFGTVALAESQQMFEELGGGAGEKPVTMFVTSWCPVCRGLEEELTARGINYLNVDVEKNQKAMIYYQKMVQGQTNGVPLTVVGSQVILGYKVAAIENAYLQL